MSYELRVTSYEVTSRRISGDEGGGGNDVRYDVLLLDRTVSYISLWSPLMTSV